MTRREMQVKCMPIYSCEVKECLTIFLKSDNNVEHLSNRLIKIRGDIKLPN